MTKKPIVTIRESETGRNTRFKDTRNDHEMTRAQFVREIEQAHYDGYHVRVINRVKTPVSNPDGKQDDNLG